MPHLRGAGSPNAPGVISVNEAFARRYWPERIQRLQMGGGNGVMAYAVSQRTREIGIRMALGARGLAGALRGLHAPRYEAPDCYRSPSARHGRWLGLHGNPSPPIRS